MLKSTLRKNSTYYLDEKSNYLNSHLVTNQPYNKDLGIKYIHLQNPKTKHPKAPIFKAKIEFFNSISIDFDIFYSHRKKCLHLSLPVRTYLDSQGKTCYVKQVNFPPAISAQILRYATEKMNAQIYNFFCNYNV